ncbi:hypothetical protein [Moritella viscosa]|uniref:hypothetical protein n=1 Tax=Moritella viscosa TaxID=80854 RepID=UPI00091D9125|nr:hypothetical protein [Moritella viscosa]SHO19011.1 Phosphoribosylformylglycinamidine synthase 2-Phosphoribosylformylglycinamidine synthase II [Moritella viscosa]
MTIKLLLCIIVAICFISAGFGIELAIVGAMLLAASGLWAVVVVTFEKLFSF